MMIPVLNSQQVVWRIIRTLKHNKLLQFEYENLQEQAFQPFVNTQVTLR